MGDWAAPAGRRAREGGGRASSCGRRRPTTHRSKRSRGCSRGRSARRSSPGPASTPTRRGRRSSRWPRRSSRRSSRRRSAARRASRRTTRCGPGSSRSTGRGCGDARPVRPGSRGRRARLPPDPLRPGAARRGRDDARGRDRRRGRGAPQRGDLAVLADPAAVCRALAARVPQRVRPQTGPPLFTRRRPRRRRRRSGRRTSSTGSDGVRPRTSCSSRSARRTGRAHAPHPRAPPARLRQRSDGRPRLGPLGGAIGLRMALPERPVVAVLGDGSTLFGVHGLWSAARYRIGVLFVVLKNGGYRIMDQHRSARRRAAAVAVVRERGHRDARAVARMRLPADRDAGGARRRARRGRADPPRPRGSASARSRRGARLSLAPGPRRTRPRRERVQLTLKLPLALPLSER